MEYVVADMGTRRGRLQTFKQILFNTKHDAETI